MRFYNGFASHGEPNIPFDKTFLQSDPFYALLARLKQHVEEHQRDHWCPLWPNLVLPEDLEILLSRGLILTAGSAWNMSRERADPVIDHFLLCRVQCSMCSKWRIVTYELLQQVSKDTQWTCQQLRWVSLPWSTVHRLRTSYGLSRMI